MTTTRSSDQASPPPRAGGDGPRRPDRHDRGRHHRHAGPAHGQARPGPGVPRRRHQPRRPFLHVPPRHGHGDEHARGLQAHELGDRLRRLDRRAGVGPAALPAVAAGHGDGPVRHGRRGDRAGDPGLAPDDPQAPGRPRGRCRLRGQGRLGVRVLRPQGLVGGAGRARPSRPEDLRPLQRGLPPAAGHQGRAAAPPAAQPDDRGERPDRVLARARRRTASTRSTSATTTSSSRPTGA